jgi:hypothetical protein
MDLDSLPVNPIWILAIGLAFLCLFVYLYRRRILFVFDILTVQALMQAAACTMAVFWIHDTGMLAQFFASQAAFTVGFLLVRRPEPAASTVDWDLDCTTDLEITTFLLFILVLIGNVWMGVTAGFPLFANDPSVAKVELYSGGLGLVKRMNGGPMLFLSASSLLLALHGRRRWPFRVIFGISLVVSVLGGSKGSLLTTVYLFVYLMGRRDVLSSQLVRLFKYGCGLLIGAGTLLSLFILRTGGGGWTVPIQALGMRILLYGDVILYYYQPAVLGLFKHLGPLDFVTYTLNPILGELRLVPYQMPLGYQMVNYTLNAGEELASILGPNTTFYVVGHIFFGPVCGILYSALVGCAFAKCRSIFLSANTRNPGYLAVLLTGAVLIAALPIEVPLFTGSLFDTVLFAGGCFLAAKVLRLACSDNRDVLEPSLDTGRGAL